tara:strand:+ start:130 stop:432 length:303 start_codon:yes stop_codon:yes gene_type:complete
MTEELIFLKVKLNIQILILRIKESREEIERKHPERTDLIKSMKESQEDLTETLSFWMIVTDELRTAHRTLHSTQTQNIELIGKVAELRKINERLMNEVNI